MVTAPTGDDCGTCRPGWSSGGASGGCSHVSQGNFIIALPQPPLLVGTSESGGVASWVGFVLLGVGAVVGVCMLVFIVKAVLHKRSTTAHAHALDGKHMDSILSLDSLNKKSAGLSRGNAAWASLGLMTADNTEDVLSPSGTMAAVNGLDGAGLAVAPEDKQLRDDGRGSGDEDEADGNRHTARSRGRRRRRGRDRQRRRDRSGDRRSRSRSGTRDGYRGGGVVDSGLSDYSDYSGSGSGTGSYSDGSYYSDDSYDDDRDRRRGRSRSRDRGRDRSRGRSHDRSRSRSRSRARSGGRSRSPARPGRSPSPTDPGRSTDMYDISASDELAAVITASSELNLSARTGPSRTGASLQLDSVATIDEHDEAELPLRQ